MEPCIRVIRGKLATMHECKTTLTRSDVFDMCDWLDAEAEAEWANRPKEPTQSAGRNSRGRP